VLLHFYKQEIPMQNHQSPSQRRRTLLKAAALAPAAMALPGIQTAQAQGAPLKVRMGYIGDFHGASMIAVANKLDLWKKHNLAPDIKVFTNGPIQIQALGSGDLDFGYIGPGALWLPITGKAKVIAINVVGFSDRVIGQPGIKSLQDLKGKTVAVPEGTSGDMLVRLALQKAGMKLEDIKRVTMDPSTIVTAFISGQVDGAGIWYPHVGTIRQRVPNLNELFTNKDALPKNSFPSSFVMRPDLDSAAGQALHDAVLRVIKEANDWRALNLAQAVDLTAALMNAPRANLEAESKFAQYYSSAELAKLTEDGTVNSWLNGMNEMFKSFGRVPEMVDAQKYYMGARYVAAK
jgi:NitT/TauT family transport system substrate-binding protein